MCPPTISLCIYLPCAMGPQSKLQTRARLPSHTRLEQSPMALHPPLSFVVIAVENKDPVAATRLHLFFQESAFPDFSDAAQMQHRFSGGRL